MSPPRPTFSLLLLFVVLEEVTGDKTGGAMFMKVNQIGGEGAAVNDHRENADGRDHVVSEDHCVSEERATDRDKY